MESRSEIGSPGGGGGGGGEDRISVLPDDLLLLILARLGCFRAAACTGIVSRRWRGLWASLHHIVFHGVPAFTLLEQALGRVSRRPPGLSLLEIRVPKEPMPLPEQHVAHSLFRAATRLDPEELVFDLPCGFQVCSPILELPCFRRTTSIVLVLPSDSRLRVPAGVQLPTLETLSLSGCTADVDALLSRCPRLGTLRLSDIVFQHAHARDLLGPRVNSASLQELVIDCPRRSAYGVHIVAPMLKQLTVSLTLWETTIYLSTPMVEKVSWRCQLSGQCTGFGWRLVKLILQTPERRGQLPSLQLHARHRSYLTYEGEGTNITRETEKHMLILQFSLLELHLVTKGHVFGALMCDLFGIHRICTTIKRLKVILQRSADEEECPLDCPCDPPNWRSQTRVLTGLEDVEINGFKGDGHEIDFLKLIFKWAPILKRMVVKLSDQASSSNFRRTKINHIFKAWSSIEFCVESTSNEYTFRRLD